MVPNRSSGPYIWFRCAVQRRKCTFWLLLGADLADPEKLLFGAGNQYRYILVKNKRDFPKAYIKKLLKEAYAISLGKVKDNRQLMEGATIVKLISPKKRVSLPKKAPGKKGSGRKK